MLILVPFMLLFLMLGLLWVLAAGVLLATYIVRAPLVLEKMLDHGEDHGACFLGLKQHNAA
jgi:cell division protein FtsX